MNYTLNSITPAATPPPPTSNTPILQPPGLPLEARTSGPTRTQRASTTARMRTGPMSASLKARVLEQMAKHSSKTPEMSTGATTVTLRIAADDTKLTEPTRSTPTPQPLGDEPPRSPQSPEDVSDDVPHITASPNPLGTMVYDLVSSESNKMSVDEVHPVATTTTSSVPCGFVIEVKTYLAAGTPSFVQTPQPDLLFADQDERPDWLLTAVNDFLQHMPYYLCLNKVVNLFLAQEARLGYPAKVNSPSFSVFAYLSHESHSLSVLLSHARTAQPRSPATRDTPGISHVVIMSMRTNLATRSSSGGKPSNPPTVSNGHQRTVHSRTIFHLSILTVVVQMEYFLW